MAPRTTPVLRVALLLLVVVITTMTSASASSAGMDEDAPARSAGTIDVGSCDGGGDGLSGECVAPAAGGTRIIVEKGGGTRDPDPDPPRSKNAPVDVSIRNDSSHRADVHFDDGRFGRVVGTAGPNGGTIRISSFVGHGFFITMHGAREGLVDPDTDEQYSFTVRADGEGGGGGSSEHLFVVPRDAAPSVTRCKDRYSVCAREAERGECTRNPGWMIVNCCKSCDDKEGYGPLVDPDVRCDPSRLNATSPAWESGGLDDLFARWATDDRYKAYGPRAMSSPGGAYGAERDGPWVLVFDDFVAEYEIEQLLEGASYGNGFQRSTDQGQVVGGSGETVKKISSTRTSSNAWCRKRCEDLPGVKSVTERIEEVRGEMIVGPVRNEALMSMCIHMRTLNLRISSSPPCARPLSSSPSGDGHFAEPLRILSNPSIRGRTSE